MPTQNVSPSNAGLLQEIADVMFKAKKVIVVTGAGISTNLGIPDFRSENGLYSLIQAQYDAAAAAAAEREKLMREGLKRSSTSLSEVESISSPDLAGVQTITASARPIELFTIRTRSKSIVESQNARIFTRSQSDIPRRATLPNPEVLLRRSASTHSNQSPRLLPKRIGSLTPIATDSSSYITSSATLRRPILKRSRSSESALPKTPTLEAPVPQRSSKRLKLIYNAPSSVPSTAPSSKDSTPAPEATEPSSQASVTSTTRAVLPKLKGKDLFDAMVWQDPLTTSIFLTFIAELRKQIRTEVVGTSQAHKLIKALRDGGRLVRCYTQNVDGLECREGLRTDLTSGTGKRSRFFAGTLSKPRLDDGSGNNFGGVEVVQLHGGLDALRCSLCGEQSPWERIQSQISREEESTTVEPRAANAGKGEKGSQTCNEQGINDSRGNGRADDGDGEQSDREEVLRGGRAPGCQRCIQADEARQHRGRRSVAVGKLRPDVVLYGEEHPEATRIGELVTHDISLGPDVLLIMGTSLRVHGLKVMVKEFARAAHAKGGKVVFINNTKPPESTWGDVLDYWVEMDCDNWVGDLKERRGELWLPQGLPVEPKKSEESSSRRISKQDERDSKSVSIRKPLPGSAKSTPASKTSKSSSTSSEPKPAVKRPQCMRDDELNGAYWAYQIQLNLEIIGGRPRTYAPNCNPHRKWSKDRWRRDSGKAPLKTDSTSALTLISTNIPRPIKSGQGKRKGNSEIGATSRAAGSQLQRELIASASRPSPLLPTPPPSDETEEPELPRPLTPRTRERIKSDSSIDRILSSPIKRRSLRSNAQ